MNPFRRLFFTRGLLAVPLLFLMGCGTKRAGVQGAVTFDAKPLEGGTIMFLPGEKQPAIAYADIAEGKYQIPEGKGPEPGSYRVEIVWNKPDPKVKDPDLMKSIPMIPLKYNKYSTMKAEVKAGMNTLNYEVVSGGPTQEGGKTAPKAGS